MNEDHTRRLRLLLLISLSVALADQLTKLLAVRYLSSGAGDAWSRFWSQPHPAAAADRVVVTGFWSFRYAENPAAAFGLFARGSDQLRTTLFILAGIGGIALFAYYLFKSPAQLRLRMLALSLLVGGTIGNCIDHLHHPYVVDFIDWHYTESYHWPTFNVADVAITVAIALLLWEAPKARRVRAAQNA